MRSQLFAAGLLLVSAIALSANAAQIAVPASNAGELKPELAGKPVIDVARSGPVGGGLSVVFAAPASNGAAAITDYAYSTNGGVNWAVRDDAGTTASPLTITNRSDGHVLASSTAYVVLVAAINATGRGLPSNAWQVTTNAALSVSSPPTLPGGSAGGAYSVTIVATGGTAPYAWSASGLPPGLTIDPLTGVVAGTLTAVGTFATTVTVTDATGAVASAVYSVVITNAPVVTLGPIADVVRATVTLTATATTPTGTVTSVRFQFAPADSTSFTDICTDTSAPFSCAWDTTARSTGSWDVRALEATSTGATASDVILGILVDNTPPTVALVDPGSPMSGTVTLAATAGDADAGVASVEFQYTLAGAATWTTICRAVIAPFSCVFDTTTVANGGYDLRAVAQDAVGNSAVSAVVAQRVVDNTLPAVSLVDPGAYLRGTVGIAAIATAPKGVNSVSIKYAVSGSTTWTEICSTTISPYLCLWDTTKVADGSYDLRAVLIDNGSVVTTSLDLSGRRVDNAPTSGVDVQSANIGVIGRMESGDAISFTFSQPMNLGSILAGWTGSSTSVVLRIRDKNVVGGGATSDVLDVFTNTTYKTAVQLGSVELRGDYVKSNKTLGFNGTMTAVSETVGGATRTKVTVTLGGLAAGSSQRTSSTLSNMVWTPSTSAIDVTGRVTSSRLITQSGNAKRNF